MGSSRVYHLAFIVFSAYPFVAETSGSFLYKKPSVVRGTLTADRQNNLLQNRDIIDGKKNEVGKNEYISNTDSFQTEGDGRKHFQNIFQLKDVRGQGPVQRMRRSAEYEDNVEKKLITDAENTTIHGEPDSVTKHVQITSEKTTFKDLKRTSKLKLHDQRSMLQESRNLDSTSASDSLAPLFDLVGNGNEDGPYRTTTQLYTKDDGGEKGSLRSIQHWFWKLRKRKNRPSWLIHYTTDSTTDFRGKQYEVTENLESIYRSVNVSLNDSNSLAAAENSTGITLGSDKITTSTPGGFSGSEVTTSQIETSDNKTFFTENNNTFLQQTSLSLPQSWSQSSSPQPSQSVVPTPSLRSEKHQDDDINNNSVSQKFIHGVDEESNEKNNDNHTLDEMMTTESIENQTLETTNETRRKLPDSLLKLSKSDGSDSQAPGNCSLLQYLTIGSVGKENELKEKKRYDKVTNDSAGCPTCAVTEKHVKLIRLNMFKDLLIQKLRLDPNTVNGDASETERNMEDRIPKLPHSVLEQTLKDNAREIEKDEFHAIDQELIIAGDDMGRDCIKMHATGCYSFNLKGRIKGEVADARVWLYKMKDANDVNGQTFNLYELERLESICFINSGKLAQSSMIVSVETFTVEDWVVLNVTRSLRKWANKRRGTEMMAVRCVTCATRSHRALLGAKLDYKPLLIIKYATNNRLMRNKRSEPCDPRFECCKRELVVNFPDIGMYHIIQPRRLSVGFCYGECNGLQQYTYNHTAIKQHARWSQYSVDPAMRQQLKPCCVPLILKDIFIMTSDGNGILIRKLLPKVIVETCGCV